MKRLIICLLLLISCACHAQISVVAKAGASGTTAAATTASINDAGATMDWVAVNYYAGVSAGVLTDSKSNTWTLYNTTTLAGTVAVAWYYCINPITGSGHTFTYTKTGSFPSINVICLGNTATASPIDQFLGSFVASGTSMQPGSITPTSNYQIILAAICTGNTGGAVSINSGFTISSSVSFGSGNNQGGALAYLSQTTAAAVNETWSWPSSSPAVASHLSVKIAANAGGILLIIPQ